MKFRAFTHREADTDQHQTDESTQQTLPQPPTGPPKICTQTSITLAPEYGAKHWQPLPYGGPEWQRVYFRLRNTADPVGALDAAQPSRWAPGLPKVTFTPRNPVSGQQNTPLSSEFGFAAPSGRSPKH
ncbi:hypothetical protein [Actinocorallia aurea]